MSDLMKPLPYSGRIPLELYSNSLYFDRISAFEAKAKRYMTGLPCKYGHVSDRFATNGQCVECHARYWRRSSGAKAAPPKPPEAPMPHCLQASKAIIGDCLKCPKQHTCAGAFRTNLLQRAAFAFPSYGIVSRRTAKVLGYAVHWSGEPCRNCKKVAWRRVRDSACSGCLWPAAYK